MKRAFRFSLVVLMLLAVTACPKTGAVTTSGADQDFIANNYQALDGAGKTVDTAMQSMGMLYKAGQFSEANKVKAVQANDAFRISYNKAVDALTLYAASPTVANKTAVTTAMVSVSVQVAAIIALNVIQSK